MLRHKFFDCFFVHELLIFKLSTLYMHLVASDMNCWQSKFIILWSTRDDTASIQHNCNVFWPSIVLCCRFDDDIILIFLTIEFFEIN